MGHKFGLGRKKNIELKSNVFIGLVYLMRKWLVCAFLCSNEIRINRKVSRHFIDR